MSYFIIVALLLLGDGVLIHGHACQDVTPYPDLDLQKFMGEWYKYASSVKCEHCCVKIFLEQLEPGVVNVTLWKKSGSNSVEAFSNAARYSDDPAVFKFDGQDEPWTIIATDYDAYGVTYSEDVGLCVLTRSPTLTEEQEKISFEKAAKCQMEIIKLNPKDECVRSVAKRKGSKRKGSSKRAVVH